MLYPFYTYKADPVYVYIFLYNAVNISTVPKRTRSTYTDVSGMLISMWCFNRCRCMLEHILKRTRSTYNDVSGMLISMWCFNRCRCMLEHILKRTRSTYNDVIPDTSLYVLLVRFNICSSIHLHLLKHHIEINIPDTSLYVLLVRFNICSRRSTYNDVSGMLISMWCCNRCRCMLEHILKRTYWNVT
jgi:hypothetical protein